MQNENTSSSNSSGIYKFSINVFSMSGSAWDIMLIMVGSGLGYPSSNPGWGYLHFP